MKFFIFTCLVAVALAKHVVKDQYSEDPARSYRGKYKKDNDVYLQTTQNSVSSSSSEEISEEINNKIVQTKEEEQKVNLNQQKKIKPFSQIFCSQFCRPVSQPRTDISQWFQSKNIHNSPNLEILEKIIDMIKNNQIQQINTYPFPQIFQPQQIPVNYWESNKQHTNHYGSYVV